MSRRRGAALLLAVLLLVGLAWRFGPNAVGCTGYVDFDSPAEAEACGVDPDEIFKPTLPPVTTLPEQITLEEGCAALATDPRADEDDYQACLDGLEEIRNPDPPPSTQG